MTNSYSRLLLTLAAALFATVAAAHDPKEHAKERAEENAKPDCDAMQHMDMSKVDPKDPVAMAMHKKCASVTTADHRKDDGQAHAHKPTAPSPSSDAPGDH